MSHKYYTIMGTSTAELLVDLTKVTTYYKKLKN